MASNYPPGVTESMIPGNRPSDIEWEAFHDQLADEADAEGLTPADARIVWMAGMKTWKALKQWRRVAVGEAVRDEREACAEIADCAYPDGTLSTVEEMSAWIAGRIRARGHRQEEK